MTPADRTRGDTGPEAAKTPAAARARCDQSVKSVAASQLMYECCRSSAGGLPICIGCQIFVAGTISLHEIRTTVSVPSEVNALGDRLGAINRSRCVMMLLVPRVRPATR